MCRSTITHHLLPSPTTHLTVFTVLHGCVYISTRTILCIRIFVRWPFQGRRRTRVWANVRKSSIIRLSARIRITRVCGPGEPSAIYFANMLRRLIFHFDVYPTLFLFVRFFFPFPLSPSFNPSRRRRVKKTCVHAVRIGNAFRNSRWILNVAVEKLKNYTYTRAI